MSSTRVSKRRRTSHLSETSLSPSAGTNTLASSCSSPAPATTEPSSSSQPDTLRRFFSWCDKQGIAIDHRLGLRYTSYNPNSWSISIHASTSIPADSVVVTIPKSAVLSRKTSALSPFLHSESERWLSDNPETVGLELSLCLLYERLLHSKSRFYPFLSILPRLPLPLPFFQPNINPWLNGTETHRINSRAETAYHLSNNTDSWVWEGHDYGMCKAKALSYFHDVGIPVLGKSGLWGKNEAEHLDGLEGKFVACYTHVSSRDFIVDAYHGVALVPVAELYNHAEVNTVQFESDQDVCECCGTALIGGHDEGKCRASNKEEKSEDASSDGGEVEEDDEARSTAETEEEDESEVEVKEEEDDEAEQEGEAQSEEEDDEKFEIEDTLDLRTLTPHSTGDEIYNTYGPLTNPLLLTRYGFCLDTETDFERYTLDLRFARERRGYLEAFLSDPTFFCPNDGMPEIVGVFITVLRFIRSRFPPSEEGEEEEAEEGTRELKVFDNLHQLESLLPLSSFPPALFVILSPLIHPQPNQDDDLVDRDQLQPLFLISTGQTSIPLFTLTYLMHHFHNSSPLITPPLPTELEVEDAKMQATLSTLHAFWTARLEHLHICRKVDEALALLQPDSKEEYITKACIQQAYQEYVSLKSALASFEELLIVPPSP